MWTLLIFLLGLAYFVYNCVLALVLFHDPIHNASLRPSKLRLYYTLFFGLPDTLVTAIYAYLTKSRADDPA